MCVSVCLQTRMCKHVCLGPAKARNSGTRVTYRWFCADTGKPGLSVRAAILLNCWALPSFRPDLDACLCFPSPVKSFLSFAEYKEEGYQGLRLSFDHTVSSPCILVALSSSCLVRWFPSCGRFVHITFKERSNKQTNKQKTTFKFSLFDHFERCVLFCLHNLSS